MGIDGMNGVPGEEEQHGLHTFMDTNGFDSGRAEGYFVKCNNPDNKERCLGMTRRGTLGHYTPAETCLRCDHHYIYTNPSRGTYMMTCMHDHIVKKLYPNIRFFDDTATSQEAEKKWSEDMATKAVLAKAMAEENAALLVPEDDAHEKKMQDAAILEQLEGSGKLSITKSNNRSQA